MLVHILAHNIRQRWVQAHPVPDESPWTAVATDEIMFVHVDPSNGIAIYDQIVRQVKFAVASDALKPGNLVPSVRELARDLTVNPNTVARAYRELQADSVLQPLRGTGLEITAVAPKKCQADRAALIRSRLRSVLAEARQSGLAADDIRSLTEEELGRLETQRDQS